MVVILHNFEYNRIVIVSSYSYSLLAFDWYPMFFSSVKFDLYCIHHSICTFCEE